MFVFIAVSRELGVRRRPQKISQKGIPYNHLIDPVLSSKIVPDERLLRWFVVCVRAIKDRNI